MPEAVVADPETGLGDLGLVEGHAAVLLHLFDEGVVGGVDAVVGAEVVEADVVRSRAGRC